jgi:hypothetical protein
MKQKTKNKKKSKAMKTTNNMKKATLKITVVLVSVFLISITTNAQNFWKERLANNQLEVLAFANIDSSSESKGVTSTKNFSDSQFVDFKKELVEEELELENWMTDENYFNQQPKETKSFNAIEKEEVLQIENWMLDNTFWQL